MLLGCSPAFEAVAICFMIWSLMSLPHMPQPKLEEEQTLIFHLAPVPTPVKRRPVFLRQPPLVRLNSEPIVPVVPRVQMRKPQLARLKAPGIHEPTITIPQQTPPAPVILNTFKAPTQPVKRQYAMVRTGAFMPGSTAKPTISKRPLREVQTGGFGAEDGIPGEPGNTHTRVAQLGSFDLPSGPGYGNGTGGAHGVPGVVASAGFGNGIGSGSGPKIRRSVDLRQAGFGNAVAGTSAPKTPRAKPARSFKPAVILSKPNPVYPAEARQLRLEGEVILSVIFESTGKVDVLRVVRALGHGMDESAISAAKRIRFTPAERDGRPVDSKALVHIIFQLAY